VSDQNQMIQQMADPLARAKGWMQLLAIVTILYGVLAALTIVGLIIAWLPIWVGWCCGRHRAPPTRPSARATSRPCGGRWRRSSSISSSWACSPSSA